MARVRLAGHEGQMRSTRVRAHCPDLLAGLTVFYEGLWASGRIEAPLKELVRMRCATLNRCVY